MKDESARDDRSEAARLSLFGRRTALQLASVAPAAAVPLRLPANGIRRRLGLVGIVCARVFVEAEQNAGKAVVLISDAGSPEIRKQRSLLWN